ncbi:MAG TPA: glutaredoxin 3 [Sphingopyxis sp.]|nr:glutaredoxin 3 [Sphingopyxis sp.]HMP45072.1 glutaredoxin 3 [Sphingopyxis sp.]HMQ19778.1 glutaredoxin 3 [Sphingopyxis sp.]
MASIEIYTKFLCPYCSRAKSLLDGKGAAYNVIDVTMDRAGFDAMVERAGGRRTVPQIFIDGTHIGGSDDLAALDARGGLDPLLGIAGS